MDTYTLPIRFGELGTYKSKPTAQGRIGKLQQVAQDYEAFFISKLLKSMRKSIVKSGLFSGGAGEETFQGLFDDRIAEAVVKRGGGLGISEMLVKRVSKNIYSHGRYDKEAMNP